jgi:hypothetical protein
MSIVCSEIWHHWYFECWFSTAQFLRLHNKKPQCFAFVFLSTLIVPIKKLKISSEGKMKIQQPIRIYQLPPLKKADLLVPFP